MTTAIDRSTRVLVVDDEENITYLLGSALRHFGFDVTTAATGRQGLDAVRSFEPDLVLLDVMLPDLDGFEVCRRMRQDGERVPVLFLTARDSLEDKVAGLTVGGDDYVTKPFSLAEIVARAHAILRRTQGEKNGDGQLKFLDVPATTALNSAWHHLVATYDGTAARLYVDGILVAGPTTVVSAAGSAAITIGSLAGSNFFGGNSSVVDTYISYLRKKVDRFDPPLIHTIRGVGYSLRTA